MTMDLAKADRAIEATRKANVAPRKAKPLKIKKGGRR